MTDDGALGELDLDAELLLGPGDSSGRSNSRRPYRPAPRMPAARRPSLQRVKARPTPDPAPANYYPDVYAFVSDFLVIICAHPVRDAQTGWRWCAHWFHHPEAVARLEAAWKAWEVLRLDPGAGASVWFRDHLDPCMAALTGPDGPFVRCSDTGHKLPPDLPSSPIPAGLLALTRPVDASQHPNSVQDRR